MAAREIVHRYSYINNEIVPDPNGGIEVRTVFPDITPEENEREKARIAQGISRILGCEVRFKPT